MHVFYTSLNEGKILSEYITQFGILNVLTEAAHKENATKSEYEQYVLVI